MNTPDLDFTSQRARSPWRHGHHLLPAVINRLNFHVGVEVGVALGGHVDAILTQCPGVTKLYGVDPYRNRADYNDLMNFPQETMNAMHADVAAFMARHGERFEMWRAFSMDAAYHLKAVGDLDFVYIDAEHTYEACKADIAAWYPLIRLGGLLSGHDYGGFPGVTRAVDKFCAACGLELHVESEYFWWAVKRGGV